MARENFVAEQDAGFYADFYREQGQKGGHIILLNPVTSPYYEETRRQALLALSRYPGGLQLGGGVNETNAEAFLRAGASHVIVTSYVFRDGRIFYENLEKLVRAIGKEHLVLDLSCRKKGEDYYIVTDRWQKFTDVILDHQVLDELSGYCDEFLIHAADVEGCCAGIETDLVTRLGCWGRRPVTYAGGVGSYEDLHQLKTLGQNRLDVTVGSALDLFGGSLSYEKVIGICRD
jgi:phosphoribosylformimino-5-aminoimidazole carboxamide ribotide isomerase